MSQGTFFDDGELPPMPATPVSKGVDLWNEFANAAGWPKVIVRSDGRLRRMKGALRDAGGLTGWKATLEACQASPFLMGRTTPPFLLTFDWLTKPANLVKVIEGNYTDRRGQSAATETWREKQAREAREALDRVIK